jgi:hypothetical protein
MIYLSLLFSVVTLAATVEIRNPCVDQVQHSTEFELPAAKSVGQVSVEVFDREKIPYIGSELGMNSIYGTPLGEPSMEFPQPGVLLVYGWCFELNGVQPTEMPDKVMMNSSDRLVWFYGYALWQDREWKTYCAPAHQRPLKSYCERQ